jgi:hypothetical protein
VSPPACGFVVYTIYAAFLPVSGWRAPNSSKKWEARKRSFTPVVAGLVPQAANALASTWASRPLPSGRRGIAPVYSVARPSTPVRYVSSAELSRRDAVRLRAATRRSPSSPFSGLRPANALRSFMSAGSRVSSDEEAVQLGYAISEKGNSRQQQQQLRKKPTESSTSRENENIENDPPTRSEQMKARWRDPVWRASMIARRNTPEALRKRAEVARKQWQDPAFRARMRDSRLGRPAPNKGVTPSDMTRLRMSLSRRGVKKSDETRQRMSDGKLNRPSDDTWPKRIAAGKKGKTREYFQMRREFRALHKDLKLWSDSYRAKYGTLPRESTFESFVAAPMLTIKIKRYLILSKAGGFESDLPFGYEIISPD